MCKDRFAHGRAQRKGRTLTFFSSLSLSSSMACAFSTAALICRCAARSCRCQDGCIVQLSRGRAGWLMATRERTAICHAKHLHSTGVAAWWQSTKKTVGRIEFDAGRHAHLCCCFGGFLLCSCEIGFSGGEHRARVASSCFCCKRILGEFCTEPPHLVVFLLQQPPAVRVEGLTLARIWEPSTPLLYVSGSCTRPATMQGARSPPSPLVSTPPPPSGISTALCASGPAAR